MRTIPKLRFGWRNTAGLICFECAAFALHFLVQPKHWIWGHQWEEYDHCLEYYGLGPLVLLCVPGGSNG